MVAAWALAAWSCAADDAPTRAELAALQERVARLEQVVTAQQAVIARQEAALEETRVVAQEAARPVTAPAAALPAFLTLSGTLEVEAGFARTRSAVGDRDASDLTLATLELAFGAELHDWLRADAVLLWEEDDTEPVDLDVAVLTLGNAERFPLALVVGRQYLPTVSGETHLITDSLPLALGEQRETAALLRSTFGPLELQAAAFNGDAAPDDPARRDHVADGVVAATYVPDLGDDTGLALGFAWISNLLDSDTLQGELAGPWPRHRLPAASIWGALTLGAVCLSAEYLCALREVPAGQLAFAPPEAELTPQAWSFEASLQVTPKLLLATRCDGSHDLHGLLPARRYGVAARHELFHDDHVHASLGLECLHADWADDDTTEDTLTLQFAVTF